MVKIGEVAPDFEMTGADRKSYKLSDHIGKPIVLAFYRGDDTIVCNRQLDQYNKAFLRWRENGIKVFGISPDEPESHFSFGCRLTWRFHCSATLTKQLPGIQRTDLAHWVRAINLRPGSAAWCAAGVLPRFGGLLSYPSVEDVDEALEEVLS